MAWLTALAIIGLLAAWAPTVAACTPAASLASPTCCNCAYCLALE